MRKYHLPKDTHVFMSSFCGLLPFHQQGSRKKLKHESLVLQVRTLAPLIVHLSLEIKTYQKDKSEKKNVIAHCLFTG